MVSYTLKIRGGREVDSNGKRAGKGALFQREQAMPLAAAQDQYLIIADSHPKVVNLNKDDIQSKAILDPGGIAPSIYSGECRWGGGELYVFDARGNGDGKVANTITGDHQNRISDYTSVVVQGDGRENMDDAHVVAWSCGNGQANNTKLFDTAMTLNAMHDQQIVIVSSARNND